MKQLLLITLLAIPAISNAHSKADYEHKMAKFVEYYNHGQGDSIANMWTPADKFMWKNERMKGILEEYGTVTAFEYLGVDMEDPNNVTVFTIHFSKAGDKTTSLTIEPDGSLGTFRFITSSPGITKLKEAAKK